MNLSAKDFQSIKAPLMALALAIAASLTLLAITDRKLENSEKNYRNQLTALTEARSRYQRSGEERETILRYLDSYRALEKIGFVGTEQRLNWMESLRMANKSAGLFGVDYQLTAQEPFPFAVNDNPIASRVKHSRMTITFGVLHEGEPARLFSALSAQQPGLFSLNGCSIDRAGGQSDPQPRQANLAVKCELSWLTLEPIGGKS